MRSSRSITTSICLSALTTSSLTLSSAFTFPRNHVVFKVRSNHVQQLHSESKKPTPGMETDESSEYEYNEAEFADYTSDYSDVNDDDDDDDMDLDDFLDDNMDDDIDIDDAGILNLYSDDYADIGGFDLSPFEKHAREVFLTYAKKFKSTLDLDSADLDSSDNEDCVATVLENAAILKGDLYSMLQALDVEASEEESRALFKYLDVDDDGHVTLEEFLPWYAESVDAAQQVSATFQNLVRSRRTVHKFDATEVDDGVLRRALECAIAAPNRRGTEPWRFIKLGRETVGRISDLRDELRNKRNGGEATADATAEGDFVGVGGSFVSWTKVPHWIVVTYAKAPPNSGPDGKMQQREDFKSTCCAVQNFLLSMWSEGIGTKWTDGPIQRTEEFAEICGIDFEKEKVAGVIWYGFAKGGLNGVKPHFRRKGVEEVLDVLP
mmetsp:Transcript_10575/g.23079  ORF Transcript_10575/g.23079 Transcript_10575/m.23079 type:complete len:436 (-) Transcript_10575:131-1438(-)